MYCRMYSLGATITFRTKFWTAQFQIFGLVTQHAILHSCEAFPITIWHHVEVQMLLKFH